MFLTGTPPVGLYEKALPSAWSWERRLTAAAEGGYDFVEISIDETDERLARLDWPESQIAGLRGAVADSGVPILTMCLSGHRKYAMGSKDGATRARAFEIMRKAIAFSVDAGVRIIQIAGYDVYYEPSDAATLARYMDGLCQAAEWAASAGVMLAVENVDSPVSASLTSSMSLVHQVNSPWFQIYPDMANVAAAGYDPVTELAQCAGRLVGIHVKDGQLNVLRGVPFGTGIVPFVQVFETLARIGFRGPMTVEMWAHLDTTGDAFGAACSARQFVAALIDATYNKEREKC
jgi:L-ribulose-5-phosphate 3-epimerase